MAESSLAGVAMCSSIVGLAACSVSMFGVFPIDSSLVGECAPA